MQTLNLNDINKMQQSLCDFTKSKYRLNYRSKTPINDLPFSEEIQKIALLPVLQNIQDCLISFVYANARFSANAQSEQSLAECANKRHYGSAINNQISAQHQHTPYTSYNYLKYVNILFQQTTGITEMLDRADKYNNWGATRLNNYELFCLTGPKHKLRILYEEYTAELEPFRQIATITVFSSSINKQLYTKLLLILPGILKNFLNLSDETLNLYNDWLTKPDDEQIDSIITYANTAAAIYNKKIKEKLLDNIQQTQQQKLIQRCTTQLQEATRSLELNRQEYESLYTRYTLYCKTLAQATLAEDSLDLSIIKRHPHIKDYDVRDNQIILTFETPLLYFDKDTILKHITDRRHLYNKSSAIKKMYDALFINNTHTLYFTTDVIWDLQYNTINCRDQRSPNYDNPAYTLRAAPYTFSNPHMLFHNCWGSNAPVISKALAESQIDYAIELTNACLMSINVLDGIVMSEFNALLNYNTESMQRSLNSPDQSSFVFERKCDEQKLTYLEMIQDLEQENNLI